MSYSYYDSYSAIDTDALAVLAGFSVGIIIISLIICILVIVSLWKIFKKAGKNGWEAIIPIYNIIVLLEICELPLWNIVLYMIPFANIYITFKSYIELAKKFGKDSGFGVLTVFFPYVCLPILAFSNATYQGLTSDNESNASILDVNETGVPNNSEETNFSYGYEKEETVVMNPVTEEETKTDSSEEKSSETKE